MDIKYYFTWNWRTHLKDNCIDNIKCRCKFAHTRTQNKY